VIRLRDKFKKYRQRSAGKGVRSEEVVRMKEKYGRKRKTPNVAEQGDEEIVKVARAQVSKCLLK